MKIYYKVVMRQVLQTDCITPPAERKLFSCFAKGLARTQYKVGEYVSAPDWLPKCSSFLFVFNCLDAAHSFRKQATNTSIFRCEAKGVKRDLPCFLNVNLLAEGKVYSSYKTWATKGRFPLGTVAVREVKLIEEV